MPVLDPLPEALEGLRVELRRTLAPQLAVYNPTGQRLTVFDRQGRPFLRIGPQGTQADLGAAAFHRSNTLMAPGSIAEDAGEAPRWRQVEASPSWGWFDLRLRTGAIEAPDEGRHAGGDAEVGTWSIPVQLGDTRSVISGRFLYQPAPEGLYQAKLDSVPKLAPGVAVHVLTGPRPGLFINNAGAAEFTVLGVEGEPFLRFVPGKVLANRNSPTWAAVAPAGGPEPVQTGPANEPSWVLVSATSSYGWIEPRAKYDGEPPTGSEPTVVKTWSVPVRRQGGASSIRGVTEWLPFQPAAENN